MVRLVSDHGRKIAKAGPTAVLSSTCISISFDWHAVSVSVDVRVDKRVAVVGTAGITVIVAVDGGDGV